MPIQGKQVFGDDIQKIINDLNEGLIKVNTQLKEMSGYGQKISGAKNIKELKTETDGLNKVNTQLKNSQDEVVKAQLKYQQASQEQKKILKDQIILENEESGTLEKLAAKNRELEREKKKLILTNKEGQKRRKEINKEQDKNNKLMKEAGNALQKQKMGIGDYSQALGPLGRGLQVVNNMFKLMMANPVVAFFAAIAAALVGIVKLFKDTDSFGTKLTGIFEGLKTVWNQFKDAIVNSIKNLGDRFELLGKKAELLKAWLSRDKEAAEKLKEEIKLLNEELDKKNPWDGFIDNAKEAARRIYEVEQSLDSLRDIQAASVSSQAELYEKFKKYQNLSKDQLLTDRERLKYLELAKKAAEKYYGNLAKWSETEFNLEAKRTAARFNMKKEEVASFIALDGEKQLKLIENDQRYANMWDFLTEGGIKNLEELYIKSIENRTEYYRRTNEIVSLSTGLEKKIQKEANEEIIKDKYEAYKFDNEAFKKSLNEKVIANQENYEKLKAIKDKEDAKELERYTNKLILASEFAIASGEIFGRALTDQEYKFQQAAKDFLLTNLKMLKAEVQQAILANSIKATAGAIASGESIATWGIAGLAKAATLVGLIEAAYVGVDALMERAIPSFYKGVENFEGGTAIIGDAPSGSSTELVKLPNHKNFLVSEPMLINLPKGSDVIPEKQIQSELANLAMRGKEVQEVRVGNSIDLKGIEKAVNEGIKKQPQYIVKGNTILEIRQGNNRTQYINKRFRHV
ncbi:MAG: hypothetical protein M0R03_20395 [Novosphingobium sp.]|nr:hypothetical protein [Novosphingobium sp.]